MLDVPQNFVHYIQIAESSDGSYAVGENRFLRVVIFDTQTVPVASIASLPTVIEGQPARFTISLNPESILGEQTRALVTVEIDNVGGNPFSSDHSIDPEKSTQSYLVVGSRTIEIATRDANEVE